MRAYTLAEVMDLGSVAHHVTEDDVTYIWTGGYAIRTDPVSGVSVLITRWENLPGGPWYRVESE